MKIRLLKLVVFSLIFLIILFAGFFLRHNKSSWSFLKDSYENIKDKHDENHKNYWGEEFEVLEINSSLDNNIQKAYAYRSKSNTPQPLIVSLHTWSNDYSQYDALAQMSKQKELNYIHPNFRGANNTINACCSDLVIADIDDAITYAIEKFNIDINNIFVIGFSGGGYTTLCTFMKSKHNISKFSAWASITDLSTWYQESELRNNNLDQDILDCTGSKNILNIEFAKKKSPIYFITPKEKLETEKLYIYTGIYDGIQGSVPITHSINFYNKLLSDLKVIDTLYYVSDMEKLNLLEKRIALDEYENIADRKIILKKEFENISLKIFEGNHEILTEFALNELLER